MAAFVLLASGVIIIKMVLSKASKRKNAAKRKNASNGSQTSNDENQKIISKAKEALLAIGCQPKLSGNLRGSTKQGHHVINKGVLLFKYNVLQRLLECVKGANRNDMNRLLGDLPESFDEGCRDLISNKMVVQFDQNENKIDCNDEVYGVYQHELGSALMGFLKNKTSEEHGKDYDENVKRVQQIVAKMKEFEVYVDPMARDRWIGTDKKKRIKYRECIKKVQKMFDNILTDFDKIADKIKYHREHDN